MAKKKIIKKRVKKTVAHPPLVQLTIRGAADHDDVTVQAIFHWLDMQKLAYYQDRQDFEDIHITGYYE